MSAIRPAVTQWQGTIECVLCLPLPDYRRGHPAHGVIAARWALPDFADSRRKAQILITLPRITGDQLRRFARAGRMTMTERSAPLVSVVMPAYQAQSFVRRAIESVKAQTFADWELVVIDDGSTDATADILIELERSDARIVALALKENSGAARARNAALKVSRGRFIAFLDSDDCWKPDKLKLQLGEMQKRGVALSFTDYRIVDTHRRVRHRSPPPAVAYDELLLSNVIGCSTAIYDRDQLGTCFFPDIRLRQDFGLWLSILRRIPAAYCCGGALTDRYLRPNSASANKLVALAATWKLYRSIERLPLLAAATCLASQAIGGIRRSL